MLISHPDLKRQIQETFSAKFGSSKFSAWPEGGPERGQKREALKEAKQLFGIFKLKVQSAGP